MTVLLHMCCVRYNLKDANTRWDAYDKDKDGYISFDEYKETMFGKQYGEYSMTVEVGHGCSKQAC